MASKDHKQTTKVMGVRDREKERQIGQYEGYSLDRIKKTKP